MQKVLFKLTFLFTLLFLVAPAFAEEINVSGTAFRGGREAVFAYMEGSFGALLMVCAAVGAIISIAFGMYNQSKYLLFVACGIFVVRSLTQTFFPDMYGKGFDIGDPNVTETSNADTKTNSSGPPPDPSPPPPPSPPPSPSKPPATPKPNPSPAPTKKPTEIPTPKPTNTPQPTATTKPTKVPTIAPTVAKPKCRGGTTCTITASSCSCVKRLAGDPPDCEMYFNGEKCHFTINP